ncbi:extracellular solute-binding protein [Chloroflexi bacterium TSY]|nr:extracellular solute-binding protein [Chloroflexi bacterium TSY]
MKYLAGMVAGERAARSGSYRVGIVASFPVPEVVRHANAVARGMRRTCPECVADIAWTLEWTDPEKERIAAEELLDQGASVIISHTGSRSTVEAVARRGLSVIVSDSWAVCQGLEEYCLGATYWNWGPVYLEILNQILDGSWKPRDQYGTVKDKLVGFYGFTGDNDPFASVPQRVIPDILQVLSEMKTGSFTRFDIFRGPLYDNQDRLIIPQGTTPTQSDLEGLTASMLDELGITDREPCVYCMSFLVEGFVPEVTIPDLISGLPSDEAKTGLIHANFPPEDRIIARARRGFFKPKTSVEFWTLDYQPERLAAYESVANRFMEDHPDISVVIRRAAKSYNIDKLYRAQQEGNLPDILHVGVEHLPNLVKDGLLDQIAAEEVIDRIGESKFYPGVLNLVQNDFTFHYGAVPYDGWVQAIWYRKDVTDKLGLASPDTWNTIRLMNQAFEQDEDVLHGLILPNHPIKRYVHRVFEQVALSAGAYPFDLDGKVTMNAPEMVQALHWYTSLHEHAVPGINQAYEARLAYETGEAGIMLYGIDILDDLVTGSLIFGGERVKITVDQLPKQTGVVTQIEGPAGKTAYGQLNTLALISGADEAAKDVVEFFLTKGYNEIIALDPLNKLPVLKRGYSAWKNANQYHSFYNEDSLRQLTTGYRSMTRWTFHQDYNDTQKEVIAHIENRKLIPRALYNIMIVGSMTPESAADWLQDEVENLLRSHTAIEN